MRTGRTGRLMVAALWVALPAAAVGCGEFEVKGSRKEAARTLAELTPRTAVGEVGGTSTRGPTETILVGPVSFAEAETAYHQGKYAEAFGFFRGYTEEKPENPWGHYMLGLAAWKTGSHGEAESEFSRVIELDPSHVKSRHNLARVYLETGYPEKALEQIEIAVGLDTTSVDGFRILGRVRDEMGFLAEAVEAYRKALVLDGTDAWSMNNLGLVLIKQDRWDEAVGPLALATQLKPEVAVFQNNLGMALELTGYAGGATVAYTRAVELDGGYGKAVTNLARVTGRPDEPALPVLDLVAFAEGFAQQVEGWKTLAVKE